MADFSWRELWENHKGKIAGAAIGLFFGLAVKWLGFFWALFVGICLTAGFLVGREIDDGGEGIERLLDRFRSRG